MPTEYQMYLFNEGTNYYAHKLLGAHKQKTGYSFAVWAPNAKSVSVVGEFNNWCNFPMVLQPNHGIWTAYVKNAKEGELYKFCIETCKGKELYKADPFAFESELPPGTASRLTNLDNYLWKDGKYIKKSKNIYASPMVIYEFHLGSWRKNDNNEPYTYTDLVGTLIPYVKQMGFTHIELMPICEHPFDGSWGYQITGFFAPTSRYGTPADFKYFVDSCHQNGIGVIIDWVPAHFPKDAHGLSLFDGSHLFEYADKRLGEHFEWGTKVFDYSRAEVQSFLISNAMFWLDEYHIDGLRVDAVSSMLYLDYNRKSWLRNKNGGNENLDAIAFLQKLNKTVFAQHPDCLMIAEESTSWANVTKPTYLGGLGFNFKWNMGWMNDILSYMQLDHLFRKNNHNKLTFSMHYAFSENYILPISHDEVVHGKRSLLDKMFGNYKEKFASLRAFYGYMFAHPGAKLIFMGCEFGQFTEWAFAKELDWNLLEYPIHNALKNYVQELIHFYRAQPALWQNDHDWNGFQWLVVDDKANSIIAFLRQNLSKRSKILVACNFTPIERNNYRIPVPKAGVYRLEFSSNWQKFGGTAKEEATLITSQKSKSDCTQNELNHFIELTMPPLTTLFFKRI